jgi:hypothetical protein
MNESDVHNNMNIVWILGIVLLGGILRIIFGIIGMFAWWNQKNY